VHVVEPGVVTVRVVVVVADCGDGGDCNDAVVVADNPCNCYTCQLFRLTLWVTSVCVERLAGDVTDGEGEAATADE